MGPSECGGSNIYIYIPQSELASVGVLAEAVRGYGRLRRPRPLPELGGGCWVLGVLPGVLANETNAEHASMKKVEGEADLVRDMNSTAIINRNKSAYDMAKRRSEQAKRKLIEEEEQRDEIRNATREINTLKCEMHEIKNLLQQLVDK